MRNRAKSRRPSGRRTSIARRIRCTSFQGNARGGRSTDLVRGATTHDARSARTRPLWCKKRKKARSVLQFPATVFFAHLDVSSRTKPSISVTQIEAELRPWARRKERNFVATATSDRIVLVAMPRCFRRYAMNSRTTLDVGGGCTDSDRHGGTATPKAASAHDRARGATIAVRPTGLSRRRRRNFRRGQPSARNFSANSSVKCLIGSSPAPRQ